MTRKTIRILLTFFLIEGLPIILFFVVFTVTQDFPSAVLTLITGVFCSVILSLFIHRRLPYFTLLASSTTVIAGALTYINADPAILITRDTIYYICLGTGLLTALHWERLPFKVMFADIFAITDTGWSILSRRWGIFLILAGLTNASIGLILPINYWVTYKALLLVVFMIFGNYQFTLFKKHTLPEATTYGLRK